MDIIVPTVKTGGILHHYHWAVDHDPYSEAYRLVDEAASGYSRKTEFLGGVKVAKYSPRVSKVRIDVRIY